MLKLINNKIFKNNIIHYILLFFILFSTLSALSKPSKEEYKSLSGAWGILTFYSNLVHNNIEEWNKLSEITINKFDKEEINLNEAVLTLFNYTTKYGQIKVLPATNLPKDSPFAWLVNDPFLNPKIKASLQSVLQNVHKTIFTPLYLGNETSLKPFPKPTSRSMWLLYSFYYQNLVTLFSPFPPHSTLKMDMVEFSEDRAKNNWIFTKMLCYSGDPIQLSLLHPNNEFRLQKIANNYVISALSGRFKTYSGIELGDPVTEIGGQNIQQKEKSALDLFTNCSPSLLKRELAKYLADGFELPLITNFSIQITRNNTRSIHQCYYRPSSAILNRRLETTIYEQDGETLYLVPANIPNSSMVKEIEAKLKGVKNLIIDLRLNPKNAELTESVYAYLFHEKVFAYKQTVPDLTRPGYFIAHQQASFEYTKPRSQFQGKIVVLMDEYTQGLGEIDVLKLQSYSRVTLIGRTSAGSPSRSIHLKVSDFLPMMVSTDKVWDKNNKLITGVGIAPDIYVEDKLLDICEGKDSSYEAAKMYLQNGF